MNQTIIKVSSWLSRVSTSFVDFCLHWLLYPFLLAIAAGAGVWSLRNTDLLALLAANKVSKDQRLVGLFLLFASFSLIYFIYITFVTLYKRRHGKLPSYSAVFPLHRLLSFIFALPIIGVLNTSRIERNEPILVFFLIIVAAVACFPTFVEISRAVFSINFVRNRGLHRSGESVSKVMASLSKYAPDIVVFCLFVAFCFYFSRLSINGLHALKTFTTDMTIYTNILYHSFHGDFLGCSVVKTGNHIAAHFDPILILFAPFFKLYPHPEFLSASQAIWLGSGIFPVYWLTRRALDSSWAGVVVAALFTLHPCLHAVILFEFHSLALVASPLLYALFFLESRYYRRFFVLLPFILFIREDVSLLMCFVGLSFILSNRNDAWVGALTILFSILYLVIVKLFLMNSPGLIMSGKDVYNYTSYFRYLIPHRGGLGDLILSILTNPIYAFKQMISMQKIEFVAVLLGPLLFIPLLSRKGLTMLLYGVIFLLLSSKAAVFNYKYHYQMVAFPVLIALVPFGLKRILETEWFGLHRKQMMIALLGTLFVASLLNGIMFGALAEKKSLYFLVNELSPKQQRVIKKVKDFVGMIEPEASVTASYNLGPFVASRMEVYSMNHYRPKTPTDYLFLDRKRTSDSALKKYDKQIKKGIFKKVAGYGSIVLYKHIPKKIRKKNVKKSKVRSRSVKKMIIE